VTWSQQQTDADLLTYLRMLAGNPQRDQFFDMRYLTPEGMMCQRFVSALRVDQLARRITNLACEADVYVGAALRERANGGKSAINGSHLLYIECDDPNAKDRLDGFAHPPTMETASGTPGHLQLYWRLYQRAANAQVESANRRLALELGGDPGCFDIARNRLVSSRLPADDRLEADDRDLGTHIVVLARCVAGTQVRRSR